ncbi:MAG: sigma-54 interaction domain-containing protein, partial [Gaiellales bacterium]
RIPSNSRWAARRIHELSSRRSGPFVSENCSAIAGEILESELFGHVQGAFTGAVRDKPGLLRMADGGTLFLDEIGDMPLALQTRLLRVLQEGEVRPVGGDRVVKVDVRIVTATHRDVSKMIADGEFREDLYYRCVVTRVDLPPLRDRREDIELLARHFLTRYGSDDSCFAPAALEALSACDWPGNIRELESAVRSAIVMARGDAIEVTDLPQSVQSPVAPQRSGGIPTTNLKELERLALERALLETNGNRAEAAKLLGISRSSVFVKIREFGLS